MATINYGNKLKLVNQYNPEKGYLDSCGHNSTKTGYGVQTSSSPDRGPGTGTWQIVRENLSSDSGPVNYGDKIKLVNQYNPEKGYLDSCGHNSTNTGYGVLTSSNPNRGPGTGTWQIVRDDLSSVPGVQVLTVQGALEGDQTGLGDLDELPSARARAAVRV